METKASTSLWEYRIRRTALESLGAICPSFWGYLSCPSPCPWAFWSPHSPQSRACCDVFRPKTRHSYLSRLASFRAGWWASHRPWLTIRPCPQLLNVLVIFDGRKDWARAFGKSGLTLMRAKMKRGCGGSATRISSIARPQVPARAIHRFMQPIMLASGGRRKGLRMFHG